MLIHHDTGDIAREQHAALAPDTVEPADGAYGLPWLFPWALALTGILITLALTR